MKRITCACLVLCLFLSVAVSARETQKIPIEKLGDLVLQDQEGLVINNINFVVEEAFFGGIKATIQCTGKNKTTAPLNYTFYVAAFDKADNLVACLGLEPFMNVHEPGKVETLEASGMIDPENKNRVSYFRLGRMSGRINPNPLFVAHLLDNQLKKEDKPLKLKGLSAYDSDIRPSERITRSQA